MLHAMPEPPLSEWREVDCKRLGEGAFECATVERSAMRREDALDRQLEQWPQTLGDLLTRCADGCEPAFVHLESRAEVREGVARDDRAVTRDPQHDVVSL